MKLDPRHLEILAAVVDEGGLTEGARALGKSQPSLSRTLSQLEHRIGAPLFEPGRRPLRPTELGRALAERGRQVLTANAAASSIVTKYRGGKSGLVRVGGTPVFMDGVIAGMIADFQQQNPDVRIDQSYGYAEDLTAALTAGTLDLAICPMRRDARAEGVEFQPILPGLNVVACRAGHPLMRRTLVTPADLAEFPWIAPPVDSPLYKDLRRALANIGTEAFKISFTGGTLASVISILTGSDALTVLPYSVVFMLRRQNTLGALSLQIGHPDRDLGLLTARAAPASPAAARFKAFVAKQFGGLAVTIQQHQQDMLWRGAR
ncbi:MAG: LysR family transcriptional regulator [Rhodobacter sp.]|nr:LysR family transcriptional regulator [Rhodobacter sp.]